MAEDDTAQRLESELLDLASRLVDAGAPVQGAGLALVGVQFQKFVDTSDLREDALIGLMDLLLDRGRTDQAMVVARATTNPRYRVQALTRLMSVVDHSTAVELAHEAEAVIAEVEHTEARAAIARGLIVALVDLGKQEWARELAVAETAAALAGDPDSGQADALIEACYALIAVGDRDRAVQAARDAWTHARTW